MVKKVFITGGCLFFLAVFFLLLPFLAAISFIPLGDWWALLIACPVSYSLYAVFLHRFIRVISFRGGYISVSRSFTPFCPIQYRSHVKLSSVVVADFGFVQGDSRGNQIFRAWDIPCLTLTLADESVERIILLGYSKKQIREIEMTLMKENGEILLDHGAKRIT